MFEFGEMDDRFEISMSKYAKEGPGKIFVKSQRKVNGQP